MIDKGGHVEPFYRDAEISCWQPLPLKARERPPVLPSVCDRELAGRKLARCVVTDIYHGLEGVERGSIRYLRILEQVARPWSARRFGRLNADEYDQQHAVVSKDTALGLKVQHGVVPVENDGSAHFMVPANANIFFQALDANYLAMQTERTFVNSNWVDTNAQYYGSYYGRRNSQDKDHPDFRPVPTWESALGIPPAPEVKP